MNHWGEMHAQAANEVTFHDAPACFPEEEWKFLKEWQKDLYTNVMQEVHQALLSLGPLIVTTVFSLRTKEMQAMIPTDSRDVERIHGDSIRGPEKLFSMNGDGHLNFKRPRKTERGERNDCFSTDEDPTSIFIDNLGEEAGGRSMDPDSEYEIICLKEDDTPYWGDDQDIERQQSPRRPTEFFIKEDEAIYCNGGEQGIERRQSTPRSTGLRIKVHDENIERKRHASSSTGHGDIATNDILCIKDEAGAYSMEFHESETGERTGSPVGDGTITRIESLHMNPGRCTHCDQSFIDHSQLMAHMKSHMKKKAFTCSICGMCFTNRTNLILHKTLHTGKKLYDCRACGKIFTSSSSLYQHQKIHSVEKPYKCPQCEKSFAHRLQLDSHQRIHTGEKPRKSTEFGTYLNQPSIPRRYQSSYTGEKLYQCSECDKSFSQSSNLSIHQRIHTGEKPYQCTECKKSFSQDSDLIKHRRIHTGEKPYECTKCKKRFSQISNLYRHQKIHSRNKP
ncbi:zinc finger protein 1 homolog isoform X2 [Ambystoma mexicanum]|uniref:zinc finger protein 1 homolog isoform X2 n=1 Tax=Ambystoma mexicanum TaxID=8296 RepID=UPI0037E7BE2A